MHPDQMRRAPDDAAIPVRRVVGAARQQQQKVLGQLIGIFQFQPRSGFGNVRYYTAVPLGIFQHHPGGVAYWLARMLAFVPEHIFPGGGDLEVRPPR